MSSGAIRLKNCVWEADCLTGLELSTRGGLVSNGAREPSAFIFLTLALQDTMPIGFVCLFVCL